VLMNRFARCRRVSALAALTVLVPVLASSHGSMESPISRIYQCFKEGPENPQSAACRALVAAGGTQPLYDWNEINQNPDGDHRAFVPDGTLCAGGRDKYRGLNMPRTDWRATNVSAGAMQSFVFHATAPHATRYWQFYITRNGWNPSQPLKWSDLEGPFCSHGNVPVEDNRYRMSCRLPSNKSGRHVIYNIWQRSDSPEAFYTCVDVNFGGPQPSPSPDPSPSPEPSPSPRPSPSPAPSPGGSWAPFTPYATGATVTFGAQRYRCIQSHTSLPGWEPPNVPALWGRI